MKRIVLTAATMIAAASLAACKPPTDVAFENKVHAYLMEHPEVIAEAMTKLQEKQAQASAEKTLAALKDHRQALENDPRDFVANPNGKITVTEFFDYNCTYCKLSAPEIVKLVQENPDVRFVFKEFVIFGADSEAAARAQLGAKSQGKYLAGFTHLMGQKPLNQTNLDATLTAAGLNAAQARAAGNSAEVTQHLKDVRDLATTLGVEGTPAFFVGDQVIPGADIAALRQAILEAKIKPA